MTEQTLPFRIIVEKPAAGIVYGLQKGSGNTYETLQKQVSDSGDLLFDIAIAIKKNKEGRMVLHGPLIHGPSHERFLYVDIGTYAGQENAPFSGRLKIPLPNILEEFITEAANGGALVTRISGTKGKEDRANTGTVKPFDGWKVDRR
jgi:hypothetical protein